MLMVDKFLKWQDPGQEDTSRLILDWRSGTEVRPFVALEQSHSMHLRTWAHCDIPWFL